MKSKFTRIVCAFLFCTFTFCYLFFYQAEVMQVTQHVASGGQTFYHPWVGAILITLTLQVLQVGINSFLKLRKRGFALTYFPSTLFLTVISAVSSDIKDRLSIGAWVWIVPIMLIAYTAVILYVKRYEPYEREFRTMGPFSQLVWINLGTLVLQFLFVGLLSNGNRAFHQRAKIEAAVYNREYKEALQLIRKLGETDSVTSMLTIYAVARTGHLGDSLFHYPLVGGGKVLRPGIVHSMLQPDSVLINATRRSANYQLTGFLLNRDLHNFARYLSEYYPVDSLRPRYYAEANALFATINRGEKPRQPYEEGSYTKYYFAKP